MNELFTKDAIALNEKNTKLSSDLGEASFEVTRLSKENNLWKAKYDTAFQSGQHEYHTVVKDRDRLAKVVHCLIL
jgi:hypothetical protein